jgi:hypothetical protein
MTDVEQERAAIVALLWELHKKYEDWAKERGTIRGEANYSAEAIRCAVIAIEKGSHWHTKYGERKYI